MQKPKLHIGDAGEKGKGVFASVEIEPDELVWDYYGKEEWVWDINPRLWQYSFQVDYDKYIVPKKESPGWYMNHSCSPNCVILGRTKIVARCRIEANEEVAFDYSTNVGWDGFEMECRCGSPECRNLITSYNRLSPELRERYGKSVSQFLVRRVH